VGDDFGKLPNSGIGSMVPLAVALLGVALAGRFALRRR
jgi:LPXTG-motif cell wall-anchored protein